MEYHFERAKSILQVSILFFWSFSLFFFFKSYEIQEKYLKYSRFILLHSILHILPCYKKYFQTRIKTRKNWSKNLKIDSANFYQNQIFQDTHILFLFSILQHIHHTVSFIQYTYSNDRNDKNFLIIPLHNLPRRSQNLSTEKRRKEDFTTLSSQYLPIGRFFVGIRACLIPT